MSFPTIANALLGPNPEYIISPRISAILDKLPSADQRQIIEQLENFIEQLRADGSTEHLQRLGVLDPKTSDTDDQKKGCVLEKCYWQLAQFYRVSMRTISQCIPLTPNISVYYTVEDRGSRTSPEICAGYLCPRQSQCSRQGCRANALPGCGIDQR